MRKSPNPSRANLSLECLEGREVLSTVNLVNGVLQVIGDSWHNDAVITETATQVKVRMESTPSSGFSLVPEVVQKSFSKSSVKEIKFWGYGGNDSVDSDVHSRPMTAYGNDGNDTMLGSNAADQLYGGNGNDTLRSGGGNDGLYGGAGNDALYGGSGADRFLQMSGQSEVKDAATEDAIVIFRNGGKRWNASEIERIDGGLKVLHQRTGNDNLLEMANGSRVTFAREVSKGTTRASNNNAGTITFYDSALTSAALAASVAIHEMAHNWDTERGATGYDSWKALSGWSNRPGVGKVADAAPNDGEKWYYNSSALFARSYGKENPREDWATAWQRYFSLKYGASVTPPTTDTVLTAMGTAKYNHLDAFFNGLI